MKKILLLSVFFSLILVPLVTSAAIVPQNCGIGTPVFDKNGNCTNPPACPCGIGDFFAMLGNIYNFLVLYIATPLAVLGLVIGGALLLLSAGNPNLNKLGRDAIIASIIGLCLAFGSWLIIKTILSSMGYVYINTLQ